MGMKKPDDGETPKPFEFDHGAAIIALEEMKNTTAMFTEIRQQFIEAGWSEPGAEQMVIMLFMKGGS